MNDFEDELLPKEQRLLNLLIKHKKILIKKHTDMYSLRNILSRKKFNYAYRKHSSGGWVFYYISETKNKGNLK